MRNDFRGLLSTTFRHRCPACREGKLFESGYALRNRCTVCGLDLEGEHGAHYGGPIILGYTVSGLAGLAAFFVLFQRFGYATWVLWASVLAAAGALLLTFRHVKAHWTWWLWSVGELGSHDADPVHRSAERPGRRPEP